MMARGNLSHPATAVPSNVRPKYEAITASTDAFCKLMEMGPGDYVNIPVHKRHRVEWTTPDTPTVWLAVHYG